MTIISIISSIVSFAALVVVLWTGLLVVFAILCVVWSLCKIAIELAFGIYSY